MPFPRDNLLKLSMTLMRLSGAKSLRGPLVSQLLREMVASSPLAKARCCEATEVARLSLIGNKQIEAVKQYASVRFPAPDLIRLLVDLDVSKGGFRHALAFMSRRGGGRTLPPRASHSPGSSSRGSTSCTHGRCWPSPLS